MDVTYGNMEVLIGTDFNPQFGLHLRPLLATKLWIALPNNLYRPWRCVHNSNSHFVLACTAAPAHGAYGVVVFPLFKPASMLNVAIMERCK